jgi:hypothetical protein
VRTRRIWTAEDRDLDKVLGSVDAPFLEHSPGMARLASLWLTNNGSS